MKAIRHFQTITKHKIYVMRECFRVGLYRQGFLHDLSKYSWTEFRIGCRYYQGTRSPNNAEREEKGYSSSWLHHKGRNKHHYEYWIDYNVNAGKDGKILVYGVDGSPDGKGMIAEGIMTATSAQFPRKIGRMAADVIYRFFDGEEISKRVLVQTELVTIENLEEYGTDGWQ